MQLSLLLQRIGWYISYRKKARSIQYIHSPFLFSLMQQVFDDRGGPEHFKAIEALRTRFLKSNDVIQVEDMGAGSVKDGLAHDRKVSRIASSALQKPRYARFLYRLATYIQARTIVEMGTSLGITTRYLALAAGKEGKVITLEGSRGVAAYVQQGLTEGDTANTELVTGHFDDTLLPVLQQYQPVDFLFIDGNHRSAAVKKYFDEALPFLHPGAVVVVDDIHWSADMKQGWNDLIKHEAVTLSLDIFQFGVLFLNQDLSRQHFILRY